MFTALSGVGFGLLIWLGLGVPALSGWAAFWAFGLAYGLSVVGLISSTLHLGHPERALKAFSQWRQLVMQRQRKARRQAERRSDGGGGGDDPSLPAIRGALYPAP